MAADARAYLKHMRTAAAAILDMTAAATLAEYQSSMLLRSAVERQFITLGEALAQLDRVAPDTAAAFTEKARIIAFRNVLVHGYSAVRDESVFEVATERLPALLDQIEALLGD